MIKGSKTEKSLGDTRDGLVSLFHPTFFPFFLYSINNTEDCRDSHPIPGLYTLVGENVCPSYVHLLVSTLLPNFSSLTSHSFPSRPSPQMSGFPLGVLPEWRDPSRFLGPLLLYSSPDRGSGTQDEGERVRSNMDFPVRTGTGTYVHSWVLLLDVPETGCEPQSRSSENDDTGSRSLSRR